MRKLKERRERGTESWGTLAWAVWSDFQRVEDGQGVAESQATQGHIDSDVLLTAGILDVT